MRRLDCRVARIGRAVAPPPSRPFLAYARAVVAYGGGEPGGDGFEEAAVGLARWLERGRRRTA
jgi:hypothetical protein